MPKSKPKGLRDIIGDAISGEYMGRRTRPFKVNRSKAKRPAIKEKGSYADKLADANRFGGKRPERKVKYYLMSNPPIAVYNDGSRKRMPKGGDSKINRTLPKRPRAEFPDPMVEGQKRYPAYNVQRQDARKRPTYNVQPQKPKGKRKRRG